MRLKSVLSPWVAALLCAASSWPATAAEKAERQMSLGDCITTALEHNLDIQIERYNPLIAEANLRLVYGDYDPQISLRASHDFNQDPGGLDAQARSYTGRETESDSFSAGLVGLLPGGLNYNVSSFVSDTYGETPVLDPITQTIIRVPFESSRAQVVIGELRQPLLRNFWIDSTRLNIKLRTKDLRISDLNLRLQIINTVSAVEQAYYDLIAARENVTSAAIGYDLAKKLYEENKKRVEFGAMAQLDERQAQSQMAASEAVVIEARRSVDFTGNILKSLLTDDYPQWHQVEIVPAEKLEALPQDFDVQAAWERAFQLRPDLIAMVVSLEKQDLVSQYAKNQLYPQLDIFGSFGWQGTGDEIHSSLRGVTDLTSPRHGYGAMLTFPLSNRRARETFRISKDERAQIELRVRQFRQQIMISVHDAIQQAQSSFERVGATAAARRFAEEALAAEEKRLANGKSTSFEVLRLQRDLTQARLDETRALADYSKALATVRQREGATLLKFNLETTPTLTIPAKEPAK
jgi:outer membrane protein TolC